jgi:hypothetical protein
LPSRGVAIVCVELAECSSGDLVIRLLYERRELVRPNGALVIVSGSENED